LVTFVRWVRMSHVAWRVKLSSTFVYGAMKRWKRETRTASLYAGSNHGDRSGDVIAAFGGRVGLGTWRLVDVDEWSSVAGDDRRHVSRPFARSTPKNLECSGQGSFYSIISIRKFSIPSNVRSNPGHMPLMSNFGFGGNALPAYLYLTPPSISKSFPFGRQTDRWVLTDKQATYLHLVQVFRISSIDSDRECVYEKNDDIGRP
jgi:hypothetical protein